MDELDREHRRQVREGDLSHYIDHEAYGVVAQEQYDLLRAENQRLANRLDAVERHLSGDVIVLAESWRKTVMHAPGAMNRSAKDREGMLNLFAAHILCARKALAHAGVTEEEF